MGDARLAPYAVLGIGVVAVSWSAIIIREAEAPVLVIASYRMVLASLPVGLLALVQQRRAPEPVTRGTVAPLLLSGLFLAAHFAFWITAVQRTSVVTAVVLVAAQPLYVALAAPLLLGERVDRRLWASFAIAAAGALIMASGDFGEGSGSISGDVYAVLGGISAAGYIIIGRRVRPTTSWVRYVGVVYPVTAVLLLATALVAGDALTGYSTKTLVMMGMMALGPQLVGHNAINWALAYLPAVVVAIAILAEPVGTTALAALILDELPSALQLIGGVVVLAGVYLALRSEQEAPAAADVAAAE